MSQSKERRSQYTRALAKVLAFHAAGEQDAARTWAEALVFMLRDDIAAAVRADALEAACGKLGEAISASSLRSSRARMNSDIGSARAHDMATARLRECERAIRVLMETKP